MSYSTLGIDMTTGQKVTIDQVVRRASLYVIGSPGSGKSGLLENLILQDIDQGLGVCVIDPHGTLLEGVIGRTTKRLNEFIYLDVTDDKLSFGLNLYECSNTSDKRDVQYRIDAVNHIFERLFETGRSSTPRLAQYLRNCSHVMVMNHLTLAEIPRLLTDDGFRRRLLQNVTDPRVRHFFNNYDRLKPAEREERADSTINKLDEILSALVRNIVGQVKSTINMGKIMDERKILLVKLDPRAESVSTLLGAMVLSEILHAAYARGESGKKKYPQFNLYMDEFPKYATTDFSLIIAELRKFMVATTYAHQSLEQPGMTDAIRSTALQAATKIVFRVSGADAQELVREFHIPPPDPVVVGTRPVLSMTQDTISHLLTHGHKNLRVSAFIQNYLAPVKAMVKYDEFYKRDMIRVSTWRETKGDIAFGLAVAMIGGMLGAKGPVGMAPPFIETPLPELNKLLHMVQQEHNAGIPLPEVVLTGFSNCGFGYYDLLEILSHSMYRQEDTKYLCAPIAELSTHVADIHRRLVRTETHQKAYNQLIDFIQSLRTLMDILAGDPILVNSGQVEPVYGTPRTYQDVANEYVQRIANFKNFTAMAKLTHGNTPFTIIRTIAPEPFDRREVGRRIAQIKDRNIRDDILRKAEDVEKEITARWDDNPTPIKPTIL